MTRPHVRQCDRRTGQRAIELCAITNDHDETTIFHPENRTVEKWITSDIAISSEDAQ